VRERRRDRERDVRIQRFARLLRHLESLLLST
jgi:hypothetical protein